MSFSAYLNDLVNQNHRSFQQYSGLRWMNNYLAMEMEDQRNALMNQFSNQVKWSFYETRPWINSLSQGCRLCGEGQWSCLFITGLCNANCFYCPTSQQADHLPTTQQFEFKTALDYAAYINRMKFKGISFSGGEPLLFFDRLTDYLTTIRRECSPDLYVWMYTNGKLFTPEKAEILANLRLDEIRFDIGATQYAVDTIRHAKGKIPHITVEIPAVPEKLALIKSLLPELIESGVTNLNLHQMRLTPYNVSKLEKHPYTYLHGEAPVVAESELAALELIRFVDEHQLNLGVNYCGFQYKNRFQKSGFRVKVAQELIGNQTQITEAGYIIQIIGFEDKSIDAPQAITLEKFIADSQNYHHVEISFFGVLLKEKSHNDADLFEIQIGNKNFVVRQKTTGPVLIILRDDFVDLLEILSGTTSVPPERNDLFTIWKHTLIERGFRDYV